MTKQTTTISEQVKLVRQTPDIDNMIGYMARVSNPSATPEDPSEKLIGYLIKSHLNLKEEN